MSHSPSAIQQSKLTNSSCQGQALSGADLIQVSLMAAGIGTILHVVQIKLPLGYVYGTGLISVVGGLCYFCKSLKTRSSERVSKIGGDNTMPVYLAASAAAAKLVRIAFEECSRLLLQE